MLRSKGFSALIEWVTLLSQRISSGKFVRLWPTAGRAVGYVHNCRELRILAITIVINHVHQAMFINSELGDAYQQ